MNEDRAQALVRRLGGAIRELQDVYLELVNEIDPEPKLLDADPEPEADSEAEAPFSREGLAV